MKIRKTLSIALAAICFSTLCSVTAISGYAAKGEAPNYRLTDKVDGENVIVTLNFTGEDQVAAGNYTIDYDAGVFELQSAVKGSAQTDINTVNSNTAGQVRGNFLFTEGFAGSGTDVVVVTLKMLNGSFQKDDIQLSKFKLSDINSNKLADETTAEALVSIDCSHPKTHTYMIRSATCTETGTSETICEVCHETVSTKVIAQTGHRFEKGVITKEPTCTEAGEKTYTCTECGETKKKTVPAAGHQYVDKIIKPTKTTPGYTRHTCSVCGHSYKDQYTDPIGPVAVTAVTLNRTSAAIQEGDSLTLTASIEPSYATDKSITWSTSDSKVAVVSDGVVTAVGEGTATITAASGNGIAATCKVTVAASRPALSIADSTISAISISKGQSFIVTADAVNGSGPYEYSLYYSYNGDPWKTVCSYQAQAKMKFTPTQTGNYQLCVKARDTSGAIAKKYYDVSVYFKNYSMVNISEISSDSTVVGGKVKITAAAQGGTGYYQFAVYYKTSDTTVWKPLSKYSNVHTVYYSPTAKGTYDILTKAKDSSGKVVTKKFSITVKEADKKLQIHPILRSSTIYAGEAVQLEVFATGGTGYYVYYCGIQKSGETDWTVVRTASVDNEMVFTVPESGSYQICVKVKDSNGTIAKKYYDITVNSETSFLTNHSIVSARSITLGQTVIMKGYGDGGSGYYEYAMAYRMSGEENWTTLQDYGTNHRIVFKPEKKGTYELCIKVKDIQGVSEKKLFDLTVN